MKWEAFLAIGFDLSLFRSPVVGIDIGSSSIKVVQLSGSIRNAKLLYAGLAEIPKERSEEKIPDTLDNLLEEGRIKKQKMGAVFTTYTPTIRYLTLPKMPKDELAEAVKWEAKKVINFPTEGMIIDFLVMGEIDDRDIKKYELLIVAVEKETVFNNMAVFKKSGIQLNLLTVNPLAMLNIVKKNYAAYEENVVYVDIGAGKTDINVSKKKVLRFTRNIYLGGNNITRAIEENLKTGYNEAELLKKEKGMSMRSTIPAQSIEEGGINTAGREEKEIIRSIVDNFVLEIQRSIDYYRAQFREGILQRIVLSGGTSLMPGFKEYMSSFFDIPVVIDNPFFNVNYRSDAFYKLESMAPRFSTSVGIALGLMR